MGMKAAAISPKPLYYPVKFKMVNGSKSLKQNGYKIIEREPKIVHWNYVLSESITQNIFP